MENTGKNHLWKCIDLFDSWMQEYDNVEALRAPPKPRQVDTLSQAEQFLFVTVIHDLKVGNMRKSG